MAAVASTARQANQGFRRSVAKTRPRLTARPGCTSRSLLFPSTAHKRQFAHRTAMPIFTKSRARARTSAATARYSSMLHCYIPSLIVTTHQAPLTNPAEINRQPRRLGITVTHTKQTPATQINRQLSGTLRNTNHNSPITNKTPSNRQWQILEFNVTHSKKTTAPRSNRHFLRVVNLQIQHSRGFYRTRPAHEGRTSTLKSQPSPLLPNRNNTSFKIPGNSLKINAEGNPNRNTNRELPLAPFRRSHSPAATALTTQHASPTMKTQLSKRSATSVFRGTSAAGH